MNKKTTPKRKSPKLEKKLDKLEKKAGKIIEGFRKTFSKQGIKSASTGLAGLKKQSAVKKYVSDAQRKAVHASKADGGKGNPNKMLQKMSPALAKISASCKAKAKKKFKVWPSAYASGWGVRCTRGDFKKK